MKDLKKDIFKLYESDVLQRVTGETLRPGGYSLTDQGVKSCGFPQGAKVLDLGCGSGATVERLVSYYQLEAVGLDPSVLLLEMGKRKHAGLNLVHGFGEDLPFSANYFDGVFAECTLSVMEDLDQVLKEIFRVIRPGGKLIVNDVYARNPEGLKSLQELNLDSCIRRALPKEQLIQKLSGQGFEIVSWSDHSNLLVQLTVDLIMAHGSMTQFWLKASTCSGPVDPILAQAAVKQAKMGYFQLIAKKDINCS